MTENTDGTGQGLADFLDYCADRGLMNKTTAQARKSSVIAVLGIDHGWETIDLRGLDIDDQTRRFEVKEKANYSPKSLGTYSSRFRVCVDEYLKYLDDPGAYRPQASARKPSPNAKAPGQDSKQSGAGNDGSEPLPRNNLITYPFPLRQGSMAYLQLPTDLRPNEAERLGKFIASLSVTEPAALPAGRDEDE